MGVVMADWLTTHYPRRPADPERYEVYLRNQHRAAADGVAIGDRVWFYEFKTAKPIKGEKGRAPVGRSGVVCFAWVTGAIEGRTRPIEYADDTSAEWSWRVPTGAAESGGFVSRADLCAILGYELAYNFRGFNGGTGLKQLDEEQAVRLLRAFRVGTPPWRVPPTR